MTVLAERGGSQASEQRIALIGDGEVGQILAADLKARGIFDITAWDCLFRDRSSEPFDAAITSRHVRAASSMADALKHRSVVISAVTAANCLPTASEAAAAIPLEAIYFDLNSVAPQTKCAAAAEIERAGGRYVEAAVMSPIAPKRAASPILIGGPHAARFEPVAREIGFTGVRLFGATLGRASAAKMCRSVMIKGIEALLAEALLAARRYCVERTVLESLRDLFPHDDWEKIATYTISRSLKHGRRRAEEMYEAARTVADAGIDPWMTAACARRQDWVAARGGSRDDARLAELLDAVLNERCTEETEGA